MARKRSGQGSQKGSTLMRVVKGLAYAGLLGVLALVVAVAVATAYLPSYGELTEAQRPWPDDPCPRGQRAGPPAARTELWTLAHLRPDPARNAGGDHFHRGPPFPEPHRRRPDRHHSRGRLSRRQEPQGQRDLDADAAASAQHLPDQQPQLREEVQGSHSRNGARAEVQQGPDPRALS